MRITYRHDLSAAQIKKLADLICQTTQGRGLVAGHRVDGRNPLIAQIRRNPNLAAGRHRKTTCEVCAGEIWIGPGQRRSLANGEGVGPICLLCYDTTRDVRPDAFEIRFLK